MRGGLFLILASTAWAQPSAPSNPAADHGVFFAPHAETIGERKTSIELYEIVLGLGLTHAPIRDLQFTLTLSPVGLASGGGIFIFNPKWVVARSGPLRVAINFETLLTASQSTTSTNLGGMLVADLDFEFIQLHGGIGGFFFTAGEVFDLDAVSSSRAPLRGYLGATFNPDQGLAFLVEFHQAKLFEEDDDTLRLLVFALRGYGESAHATFGLAIGQLDERPAFIPIINGGLRF